MEYQSIAIKCSTINADSLCCDAPTIKTTIAKLTSLKSKTSQPISYFSYNNRMNETCWFLLNGLSSLPGVNEHMLSFEGDIDFIEVSSSGRLKWEISNEKQLIRTGFVYHNSDTALIKEEGTFFLRFQNREKLSFDVYVRVKYRKPAEITN